MPAFQVIADMLKEVAEAQPIRRTDCPNCGETLKEHPVTKKLHCPMGDWAE